VVKYLIAKYKIQEMVGQIPSSSQLDAINRVLFFRNRVLMNV